MLNPDSLVERARLRSQVTLWRAFTFIALILAVFAAIGGSAIKKMKPKEDYIARIAVEGLIFEDQDRLAILKEIEEDKNIKAVLLRVNSPGGTAVGGEELYKALARLNDVKPVVAIMDSLAASAGYMVTLGCERIFAHNGTITGSIGVIMQIPNLKELAEKLGVKINYVKTSPLKGSPDIFENASPEAMKILEVMMQDFYKYFVQTVSTERSIPPDTALKLADGRVYSGREAVNNKLVDDIGGEHEALDWLVKNQNIPADLKVMEVKLHKPKDPFAEFLGSLSENFSIKGFAGKIFNLKGLAL